MIGTEMRGLHHLLRVVGATPKNIIFKLNNGRSYIGEVIAVKNDNVPSIERGNYLLIYNNSIGDNKPYLPDYDGKDIFSQIDRLNDKWNYCFKQKIGRNQLTAGSYLLPDSFYDDFDRFINENKKQFTVVERKYAHRDDPTLKLIYALCDGSKNYFFWAVALFYNHGIDLCDIKRIMDWSNNYPQLVKKLSKGTATAYTNHSQFQQLLIEIVHLRKEKRINDVINSFNTAQKKALRDKEFSDRDNEILSKFGKLSEAKKINFIRKMSTIDNPDEIMKQMSYLVNVQFDWNKDALISMINNNDNIHAEIISANDTIVLVKVDDYDAVKYLGKATNWCISKNKTYWNQYVGNFDDATQYMIFDFSKPEDDDKSIIGFTSIFNKGITNAHDFVNNNLMTDRPLEAENCLNSFLKNYQNRNGIFSILNKDGIDLNDVTSYEKLPYKWTREGFFEYLNKFIDPSHYDIVCDTDDKVAIIVNSSQIRYFLGKNYEGATNRDTWKREHIIFADFSKKESNQSKLAFGIVSQDDSTYTSYVQRLYNEHFSPLNITFNYKLAEFNIPYDIICRTDNIYDRLYDAVQHNEYPIVKQLLENEALVSSLKSGDSDIDTGYIFDFVNSSITCSYSLDVLNMFYEKGITMQNLLNDDYLNQLFYNIFRLMYDSKNGNLRRMIVPGKKDFEKLDTGEIDNFSDALYVGLFTALNELMDKENCMRMYANFFYNIRGVDNPSPLLDYIAQNATKLFNPQILSRAENDMMRYVATVNNEAALENIFNKIQEAKSDEAMRWFTSYMDSCGRSDSKFHVPHSYFSISSH